jgi:signal transduction histidine kinase
VKKQIDFPNNLKLTRRSGVELIAILTLAAIVLILGILQYRWTDEISRTEQTRLKASLGTSVRSFNQEFSYDFQQLCGGFDLDPEAEAPGIEARVLRQHSSWMNRTAWPGLLGNLYIWKTANTPAHHLESFDTGTKRFQDVAWPARLESLRQYLETQSKQASAVTGDREAIYYPWTLYEDPPILVRPIFQISSGGNTADSAVQPLGYLIVELNEEFLRQEYLPGLVDHYFGTAGLRSFGVAVRSAEAPYRTIYVSDVNFPVTTSAPDSAVNLADLVGEEAKRRGHPTVLAANPARQWQLVVQHPAGSLDIAVSSWRRRNLGVSLILLFVLGGSMALIFSAARRSKMLARLQREFFAGVSHELCTPLAVINSAAENLADGTVDSDEQIREYGGLIRGQGRRLERLVDEVLLFTAGRFGLSGYELGPMEIGPVIEQSLAFSGPILSNAGFTLEKEIGADLPLVLGDPAAVTTCVENLVSNAMKYSEADRWIAVRARVAATDSKSEVQVSVEDRGIGIPTSDLPHIFEPFYRVQAVRDNHVRGVGLGLYLVKRMMEDTGGRVSVSSKPGSGTAFILHFPLADSVEHSLANDPGNNGAKTV